MSGRVDPARTGVKAGRVVGVLTAGLIVVSLLRVEAQFVGRLVAVAGLLGIDPRGSVQLYFYLYVGGAAVGRYGLCYVVGSLVGVVYDWLDRPQVTVLVGLALVVGVVDGVVATVDTGSVLLGAGYVLAWLCYVPAFLRVGGVEIETDNDEPRRFHDR